MNRIPFSFLVKEQNNCGEDFIMVLKYNIGYMANQILDVGRQTQSHCWKILAQTGSNVLNRQYCNILNQTIQCIRIKAVMKQNLKSCKIIGFVHMCWCRPSLGRTNCMDFLVSSFRYATELIDSVVEFFYTIVINASCAGIKTIISF